MVGDLERVSGRFDGWVSEKRKKFGKEFTKWVSTEEKELRPRILVKWIENEESLSWGIRS